MPDLKKYSTGRIGNTHALHLNTDHVNTRGLDSRGLPGIEAFIDEDIVRAYDDNRPLTNLLSNEEIINRSVDSGVRSLGINAALRNDSDDWRLSVEVEGYYSDPENFAESLTITPLKVAKGVAYAPDKGYITTGFKKLSGFRRDDGSTIWVDEHSWYYSTSIILDDTTSYAGFYKPIYVELAESLLPANFTSYEISVRQLTTTGNIYTYPIYFQEDLLIPYKSSTFDVTNEPADFENAVYPGYDFYPDSFVQLEAAGLGILEVGEDTEVIKKIRREGYRILASDFNAEVSAYKASLKEDIFRSSKSAHVNRIENDLNFIRSMNSVKAYNGSSRVYFKDFKSLQNVLQPLKDNRNFLGNQQLSFEIAFVDASGEQDQESEGFYFLNGEDLGPYTAFDGLAGVPNPPNTVIARSNEYSLHGDYSTKLSWTINDYDNWVCGIMVYPAIYESGTGLNLGTDIIYERAWIYIPSSFRFNSTINNYVYLTAIGWKEGLGAVSYDTFVHFGISTSVSGTNEVPTRWSTRIKLDAGVQYSTTNFSLDTWHEITLIFRKGNPTGGGAVYVDGSLIYSNFSQNYSTYNANRIYIGTGYSSGLGGTVGSGSYFYIEDIKADRFPITYDDKFEVVELNSPETRGYQDFGASVANPNAAFGLNSTYNFNIKLNNDASLTNLAVTLVPADTLNTLIIKIQVQLNAIGIYAYAMAFYDGPNWDLRIYSKSSGDYSKVALTAGSPDLATAIGGSYQVAVNGETDWPIYFNPTVPGIYQATRTGGTTIVNNFDPGDVGYKVFQGMISAGFDNFTVAINTNVSFSHTCELYVEPSTTHTQGHQDLGMNVPDPTTDSGLFPLSEYFFQLDIDGAGLEELSLITTTDVTYNGVINALNSLLAGRAIFSFTPGNDVRISSDSYGPTSSIQTANGVTGNSLFGFAYPAAGFTPAAQHLAPIAGVGKLIYIRPRKIETFVVHTDSIKERLIYSHNSFKHASNKIRVTPDTETNIRDYIDTEHAYITGTSANRWSTHNDRVITIDLSTHPSWIYGAIVSKLYSLTIGANKYLLVGNSFGQIFFSTTANYYDDNFSVNNFTLLTSGLLGQHRERVNNFFIYNDTINSKKFLFVLTGTHVYISEVTSGLIAGQVFVSVDTSFASGIPNVTDRVFTRMTDAIDWDAKVDATHTNKYIIIVGECNLPSNWLNAPIIYGLYNSTTFTFEWYADEIYKRTQINNITSIKKFNGWSDPEQSYQLFMTSNVDDTQDSTQGHVHNHRPELWVGNSQNNYQNIGGPGDERFNRFSWIESNLELGNDALNIDEDIESLTTISVFDSKLFIGGIRSEDTYSGLYSYSLKKFQKYFAIDVISSFVSSDNQRLFVSSYRADGPNADPAVLIISEEQDDGRAQIFSKNNLTTVANWPSNSSFRVTLNGFNVGGIDYDGEYNIVFSGQGKTNLSEIVDAINGVDIAVAGFEKAIPISNPLITVDLTPVIRARALTSLERFGNTYTEKYKLVIESKISDPGEASGHSSSDETTQSDCWICITAPTTGTSIVGTGSDKIEIDPGTYGYANLQMIEWTSAKCYQVRRISSSGLSFGGNSYINISSLLPTNYKVLTGSFRVKANATDEIGFTQSVGKIIRTVTPVSLVSGTYTFEVFFNINLTPSGNAEITDVTCPANPGGALASKYWLLNSPTEYYYVWYNNNGTSTDPAVPGRVAVPVVVAPGASSTIVATATAAAINALADFGAVSTLAVVTITNAAQGNVVDALDIDAGVSVLVTTQGSASAPIRNLVTVNGTTATTIQNLLNEINADLSGGVASLQQIGATGEYCDIVITSNYIGNSSSVEIEPYHSFGTYLFSKEALDLIPNSPIAGSTGLGTAGSQTCGYTWENSDYFIEYNHPTTSQVRIYIPNGSTRLDTGATVWFDFWATKELTKISAKIGDPPINNIPTAGQWTFDLEQKKIVLGEQPTTTAPEDYIFVDVKIQKILRLLDLGSSLPVDQTEFSNLYYSTEPRKLTNSDMSLARSLARLSALYYGVFLWGTDEDDVVATNYSFFLPRLDLIVANRDPDIYGNRVRIIKGVSDSTTPYLKMSLTGQDELVPLYTAYINSQDYNENDIVVSPWYLHDNLDRGKIFLDGTTQYFMAKNDFISTRGLAPSKGAFDLNKLTQSGDYDLVKITDPVGIRDYRKRSREYLELDESQVIFIDSVNGSDANSGFKRLDAKLTIQAAVNAASSTRPYVFIIKTIDNSEVVEAIVNLNKTFKIYVIAEHIASIGNLNINGPCFVQGFKSTIQTQLQINATDFSAKYCDFEKIQTSITGTYANGIGLDISNSIIHEAGVVIAGAINISGAIHVSLEHVYISEDVQLMQFDPTTYNTTVENTFVFTHVTNDLNTSGYAIVCPESSAISIEINRSMLPAGTLTRFNSNAPIVLNESITYIISNDGTGSVITNDSQLVDPGDIDVVLATGALVSIARGYTSDSLALNYVNRELDAGAFLEERVLNSINKDERPSNRSYLSMRGNRVQYRYNVLSDSFAFYLRFKPQENYQQTGILFDSRYSGDFDTASGLFNQNSNDFIQIVYNNEVYERNDLAADKYAFKLIISNGSQTNIAVIGPFFTVNNNSEYNLWHEISVLMYYADTYNPKYFSADLTGRDKARKQLIIYVTFDRDLDRIYSLKNEPYEDVGRNEIPTSNWYPGMILSRFFNIGSGWSASWLGTEWSVWSEADYMMLVDDFMISSDIIPVNILRDFGAKEKIDLKANDFKIPRFDDNRAGIVIHCNNPHPFSDTGLQPYDTVYTSFRQYEGFISHGLAIESDSPNFLIDGRIRRGNWFDRGEARVWDATTNWILWGASTGSDGSNITVLAQNGANDLRLLFIDPLDGSTIVDNVAIVLGAAIAEAILGKVGSKYIVGYIPGDNKFHFKTVDASSHTVAGPYIINNAATSYISMCQGHSSSQVAFLYRDNTTALGYATVMNTSSGAIVVVATEIANGADIMHNAITETNDKDGNPSYMIFYREASSDWLKFVMWEDDFAATVFPHDTLIQTDTPIDIKTTVFIDGQTFVKWKDYNAGADSPIKAAYINREGFELVPPFEIFATGDPNSRTDDFVQQRDFKVLLAIKDRTSQHVYFKVYQETGTIVEETDNSPYLRPFNASTVGKVLMAVPDEGSNILITDINNGTYNTGNVIELQTDIPSRWFSDFTGVFDQFEISAERTRNLFGWAYYNRFNHVTTAGETGVFVADAETNNLNAWNTYVPSNGSVTTTAVAAAHGNYGYEFTYDGTGADLRLIKTSLNMTDAYARFYLEIDRFFALTGSSPKRIEIARFGSTDPLILKLEYNDPLLGGDGKFKLYATTTSYGNDVTVSSVINYSTKHYIDMRYRVAAVNGGWEVWIDGVAIFSHLTYNTTASGNVTFIQIGSFSAGSNTPNSNSKLYFDDVRVDTSLIGEYTAGLGQGEIWQLAQITVPDVDYFVSGYYWILSGQWVLRLEGTALIEPIEFTFQDDLENPMTHNTITTDSVSFTENTEINFNRIRRFLVKFVPDNVGEIKVRLLSANVSGVQVDEFYVDNIKLEKGTHPTSIEAESEGYAEYPYSLKSKGSAFFRFIPEFFAGALETDHTLFAAYSKDETGAEYITHELYYDESENRFKFYVKDADGTTAIVQSNVYGAAASAKQYSDLRDLHTIICNWDLTNDYIEMFIDNEFYRLEGTGLGEFNDSSTVVIGNKRTQNTAADSIFDLIRIGEEALGIGQIQESINKRDPFFIINKTDTGSVSVRAISFFGITSFDQFERTMYTEKVGDSWRLVIDKGNDFGSEIVIRHDERNIVVFSTTGVTIDGSLNVGTLIAQTTATINTTDDHLTLRYGFSGSPPDTNDGYIEVERGNLVNSEIRWDESQEAWVIHNGIGNRISIDDRSIGTWDANNDFVIAANGVGAVRIYTSTSTNGGSGDGTIQRTIGNESASFGPSEIVLNSIGLDVNLRVRSTAKPYMLFLDASIDKLLVGRISGIATGALGNLVVNDLITSQYQNDTQFGAIEFRNNSGTLAGSIGGGDGTNYWTISSDGSKYVRVNSPFEMGTGKSIRWQDDPTNSALSYTADAPNQSTGTSDHGVYCYGSFAAYRTYNGVWNDYAEAFEFDKNSELTPEAGFVYKMTERGLIKTDCRADPATVGVFSDTFGQLMNSNGVLDVHHPNGTKLPIGLAGKVKVWVREKLEIGDPLISDVGGFATKVSAKERRNYPDLIIGKVLETSKDTEEKRIWILIK